MTPHATAASPADSPTYVPRRAIAPRQNPADASSTREPRSYSPLRVVGTMRCRASRRSHEIGEGRRDVVGAAEHRDADGARDVAIANVVKRHQRDERILAGDTAWPISARRSEDDESCTRACRRGGEHDIFTRCGSSRHAAQLSHAHVCVARETTSGVVYVQR